MRSLSCALVASLKACHGHIALQSAFGSFAVPLMPLRGSELSGARGLVSRPQTNTTVSAGFPVRCAPAE